MTKHRLDSKHARGEAAYNAKLTARQVIEIFYSPEKAPWLAVIYNTSSSVVNRIRNKKAWAHLTKDLNNDSTRPVRRKVLRIVKEAA